MIKQTLFSSLSLTDQLKDLVNEFSQDKIKNGDDFKNDVEEVKNEDFKENDEEQKDVESMCFYFQ